MNKMLDLVRLMHTQFNIDCSQIPFTEAEKNFRVIAMQEELDEYADATDNAELLDALVDLTVFALGTAERMGLLPVFEQAFTRVMHANMQKQVGGNAKRGDFAIDLVKPTGWQAPVLDDLVAKTPIVQKELPIEDKSVSSDNTNPIAQTRQLRASRYGRMEDIAQMTQTIIKALSKGNGFVSWTAMHDECVHMIVHKLCRMACGDCMYSDNAHDIAGYAQILDEFLINKNGDNV